MCIISTCTLLFSVLKVFSIWQLKAHVKPEQNRCMLRVQMRCSVLLIDKQRLLVCALIHIITLKKT